MAIREVPLKKVVAPFQVREPDSEALSDESIRLLAEEMKINGIWDLALPAREVNGQFEVACGSRRIAAYRYLKLADVRLDVKARTDEEMARIAAVENTAREPLSQDEMRKVVATLDSSPLSEVAAALGVTEKTVARIRTANKAIAESGAKTSKVASSAAIAAAAQLGKAVQKIVAEKALSVHAVEDVLAALEEIRTTIGNLAMVAVKKELGKSVEVSAVAVERAARKFVVGERSKKAKAATRKKVPPDLKEVLRDWTYAFETLTKKLDIINADKENFAYMEEFPATAKDFRKAVANLSKRLEMVEARLAKF